MPESVPNSFETRYAATDNLGKEFRFLYSIPLLSETASEYGLPEIIGIGSKRIVFAHPVDTEKVIALDFDAISPLKAKELYYAHKILNLLFPDHFPTISASYGEDATSKHSLTGTVRQRLHSEGKPATYKGRLQTYTGKIDHPLSETYDFLSEFQEVFLLELEPVNIEIARKQNQSYEYYVDTAVVGEMSDTVLKKLQSYMVTKNISQTIQKDVMRAARKIHMLQRESKTKTSSRTR